MLTHRHRLEKTLAGEIPDLTPIAMWRHFPVDDQTPYHLYRSIVEFQKSYDFDFIKVTPASSYCLKDWGETDTWKGNPEGTREYTNRIIQQPEDWLKLGILHPQKGYLGEMLDCLSMLVKDFSTTTPVIQTIFNPLSQAKNLAGRETLLHHLRNHPAALLAGLETITQSTMAFLDALRAYPIDGIFLAIQHASFDQLTEEEYRQFGRPFDLHLLQSASGWWLNMAHIHGENIMFDLITDYPVSILNWHDRQTAPSLLEAQSKFSGAVCGGLRQWETMVLGTPDQVTAEATDAIHATGNRRFIMGTGCVLPITTPWANIRAALACARNH